MNGGKFSKVPSRRICIYQEIRGNIAVVKKEKEINQKSIIDIAWLGF